MARNDGRGAGTGWGWGESRDSFRFWLGVVSGGLGVRESVGLRWGL
jgi:hypothetical protein